MSSLYLCRSYSYHHVGNYFELFKRVDDHRRLVRNQKTLRLFKIQSKKIRQSYVQFFETRSRAQVFWVQRIEPTYWLQKLIHTTIEILKSKNGPILTEQLA